MKRLKLTHLITSLILSVSILSSINTVFAQSDTIYYSHQGGQDRYETCKKLIYRNITTGFKYAVLVSGSNYPDSLSAAPLAKQYNAPIILLPTDSYNQSFLDDDTIELLKKRGVKQVFIIGGTGVISRDVDRTLNDMKISSTRISGKDRYETSIKVAEKLPTPMDIFITTGEDFRDALSISSIAAKKESPIILVPNGDNLPDSTKEYLDEHNTVKTYVVGENDVVSDSIYKELPSPTRITGRDSYERNANIINKFSSILDFTETYITSGEGFADGLGASVIASQTASPIVLVKDPVPTAISNLINSKASQIKHITVLGGEGAVSNSTLNKLGNFKEEPYLNEIIQPYYAAFDANNRSFYSQNRFTFGSKYYYGFQMANFYSSNLNTYMSFDLQGKYKNITGKVGITRYGNEGILKVYGDDKLLDEIKVQSLDDLTNIDIDVEDITTLKFVFIVTKGSSGQSGNLTGLSFIDTNIR